MVPSQSEPRLTLNSWTFLFEVVNFLALAYILQRLLYKPLHDAVDRRRQSIERAQAGAARAKFDAEEERSKLESEFADIRETKEKILEEIRGEAEAQRERVLAEAAKETARRQELAHAALDRERRDQLHSLQQDVVADASRLAERLLRDVSDVGMDARLAGMLVEAVGALPQKERDALSQNWTPDKTATLETAHELPPDSLETVHKAVDNLMGHHIALQIESTPELVSGVRLRLDGHVWDASLAGRLEPSGHESPILEK